MTSHRAVTQQVGQRCSTPFTLQGYVLEPCVVDLHGVPRCDEVGVAARGMLFVRRRRGLVLIQVKDLAVHKLASHTEFSSRSLFTISPAGGTCALAGPCTMLTGPRTPAGPNTLALVLLVLDRLLISGT